MTGLPEDIIAEIAARQHGLVTRRQLLLAGLSARMIEGLVKSKRLRALHRGVYLVAPAELPRTRDMAAVLACGPAARLSHRSAAAVWGMAPERDRASDVEVTGRSGTRCRRPGIRLYRVAGDGRDETTVVDGIPITTPARTLIDLARILPSRELEQAAARAERLGLIRPGELASIVRRYRGRRGMRMLQSLIDRQAGPALTRSEAEARFRDEVRRFRLPPPETNVVVAGYELDFLWRPAGLAVEIDGHRFHSRRHSFENDRRRDAALAAVGIQVIRITWRQLVDETGPTIVRIAQALAVRTVQPPGAGRLA